jgi:microcystin-dependent protein
MFCNGQLLADATYPVLRSRFGTQFGGSPGFFALPDLRGRVVAHNDFGVGRLANFINGGILGAAGGKDTHTITVAEMPVHRHLAPIAESPHNHAIPLISTSGNQKPNGVGTAPYDQQAPTGASSANATTGVVVRSSDGGGDSITNASGGGAFFDVAQPTIVLNAQVKLG